MTTPPHIIVPLISDIPHYGRLVDPQAHNSWGLVHDDKKNILYVAQNGTGVVSRYTKDAILSALTVPGGAPTGLVANHNTNGFFVTPGNPAQLITVTENGTIAAFNALVDASNFINVVSSPGKVFKGVALHRGNTQIPAILYVTNFSDGVVEMYNSTFALTGTFTDLDLLANGYAPFNVEILNNLVYVTFAKQDESKTDDVAGIGNGYIDVFTLSGTFVFRLANRGHLNAPWGLAEYLGYLLVGNFGDGHLLLYNFDGRFVDFLKDKEGNPLVIDGLWGLRVATKHHENKHHHKKCEERPKSIIYFAAGINDEVDGLIGLIEESKHGVGEKEEDNIGFYRHWDWIKHIHVSGWHGCHHLW
jgi:uncharacterized protein (TIGR03118 family)